jgi:two-component system, LuxR family, sensor kinase FixL
VEDLAPDLALSRAAEARGVRRDGTVFPAEVSVGSAALRGRTLHVAIVRDMSQRKAIEERLRDRDRELNRAMRVAAAAEMASALAHELNQPLTAASGYVQACDLMLQRAGGGDRRLFDAMEKAVFEVKRAAEVVRRLREFYRGGTLRAEPVPVGELCRHMLQVLHNRLERHGVTVTLDMPSDLPPVKVDRVQMEMVLHNLFANAIDSMKTTPDGMRHIDVAARAGPEGLVQLSVHDTGPGLSPGVADTLFQAFATSKAEGMGMGLAISRSIVEHHGGRLWLDDARPGATFALTLPVARADAR